jgi:excisionase family DNA binding protein
LANKRFIFRPRHAFIASSKERGAQMDVDRIQQEMRALAEERIDRIAGPDAVLLPKSLAAQVCGKSYTWIERMVAAGRLPTVAVGRARWIQRAALVEALAVGV